MPGALPHNVRAWCNLHTSPAHFVDTWSSMNTALPGWATARLTPEDSPGHTSTPRRYGDATTHERFRHAGGAHGIVAPGTASDRIAPERARDIGCCGRHLGVLVAHGRPKVVPLPARARRWRQAGRMADTTPR